jgi:hypothetical protein
MARELPTITRLLKQLNMQVLFEAQEFRHFIAQVQKQFEGRQAKGSAQLQHAIFAESLVSLLSERTCWLRRRAFIAEVAQLLRWQARDELRRCTRQGVGGSPGVRKI